MNYAIKVTLGCSIGLLPTVRVIEVEPFNTSWSLSKVVGALKYKTGWSGDISDIYEAHNCYE